MKNKKIILLLIVLWGIFCTFGFGRGFEVKVQGQGPALLLIPGLTCSGEVWNETVDMLKDHYECHVVTIAGFAGVEPTEANRKAFLESVLGDLESYIGEQDGPVSVIGHSIGGFMGMNLAARLPKQVERVVVVDSYPQLAGFMMGESVDYDLLRQQMSASRPFMLGIADSLYAAQQTESMKASILDQEKALQVAQWGIDSDRATMLAAYEEVLLADIRPELPQVEAQVLVLQSFNHLPLSKKEWKQLNERQFGQLEGVQIHRNHEGGHFLMYDVPTWYANEIRTFLL